MYTTPIYLYTPIYDGDGDDDGDGDGVRDGDGDGDGDGDDGDCSCDNLFVIVFYSNVAQMLP